MYVSFGPHMVDNATNVPCDLTNLTNGDFNGPIMPLSSWRPGNLALVVGPRVPGQEDYSGQTGVVQTVNEKIGRGHGVKVLFDGAGFCVTFSAAQLTRVEERGLKRKEGANKGEAAKRGRTPIPRPPKQQEESKSGDDETIDVVDDDYVAESSFDDLAPRNTKKAKDFSSSSVSSASSSSSSAAAALPVPRAPTYSIVFPPGPLGLSVQQDPSTSFAVVIGTVPGGAASHLDVRLGSSVLSLNDVAVSSYVEFLYLLQSAERPLTIGFSEGAPRVDVSGDAAKQVEPASDDDDDDAGSDDDSDDDADDDADDEYDRRMLSKSATKTTPKSMPTRRGRPRKNAVEEDADDSDSQTSEEDAGCSKVNPSASKKSLSSPEPVIEKESVPPASFSRLPPPRSPPAASHPTPPKTALSPMPPRDMGGEVGDPVPDGGALENAGTELRSSMVKTPNA